MNRTTRLRTADLSVGGLSAGGDLSAVIADDEGFARAHLRELLRLCGVDTVRECAIGDEVVPAVRRSRPDLVCLDIRMPGMSGLEVARLVDRGPAIVFTTGYPDFAAEAFELNAVDYLLKPLTVARVGEAVRRVRARVMTTPASRQVAASEARLLDRVFLPSQDHTVAVATDTIRYVEARSGASVIHTDGGTHRARTPLGAIERVLAPCGFVRTHRAYLVNLRRVRAVIPWSRDAFSVLLDGGEETHVPVAKSRVAAFRARVVLIPGGGGKRGSRAGG